jgi:alpha,alpha-trehalase
MSGRHESAPASVPTLWLARRPGLARRPRLLRGPRQARVPLACAALALLALVPSPPSAALELPAPPQVLYGELFEQVQMAGVFNDSKDFCDAIPKGTPEEILARYRAEKPATVEALRAFVKGNFTLPGVVTTPTVSLRDLESPPVAALAAIPLTEHIDLLWNVLTRRADTPVPYSSLLPLPRPFVVPGGRFREIYYWDSYFTMLGLLASGRQDLTLDMVSNFAYLLDTYGRIPNGNRTYYLSRSQPPFFFAMVALLSPEHPEQAFARYLPELRREHAFWMEGAAQLAPGSAARRVVALAPGVILNRYWDDLDLPRDESFREDVTLARATSREPGPFYRDVRAAAESGWDFGSRWLADGHSMASIDTTAIVPADLNSLLFGLERAIAAGCRQSGDGACGREFTERAEARRVAMNRYLWDQARGAYLDYQWQTRRRIPRVSAATLYPLFAGAASPRQAAAVARTTRRQLLKAAGLVATPLTTGQQWDAPNGWAPLQWIGVAGLRAYGDETLAQEIACRWVANVGRFYHESGRLLEKYDVVNPGRPGGGGEYPLQDGFGWTNGVTRRLLTLYPEDAAFRSPEQCPAAAAGVH